MPCALPKITAAANTGPASGPRPASSTPQRMSVLQHGNYRERSPARRPAKEARAHRGKPLGDPLARRHVGKQIHQRLVEILGCRIVLDQFRDDELAG